MPTYTYTCPSCGNRTEQTRPIANRNDPLSCTNCGESLRRRVEATRGLLPSPDRYPQEPHATLPTTAKEPNVTVSNCIIKSSGGGFLLSDGFHLKARDLTADITRPLFELSRGATVDAANIIHHSGPSEPTPVQRKEPRKRRTQRLKRRKRT